MRPRKTYPAILIATALGATALVSWQQYQNHRQSEEFVEDVVSAVYELHQTRRQPSDTPRLENGYQLQQHVADARRLLSPWISDTHSGRRKIARAMQDSVTEYERAAELFLQIARGSNDEEKLAEFTVKVNSARSRLMELTIVFARHRPALTKACKRRLIRHIDSVFTKQLLDEHAEPKDDPNAPFYSEVFAASTIKRILETSVTKDWN